MHSLRELAVEQQLALCQGNAAELAAAFSRALDGQLTIGAIEGSQLNVSELPRDLSGPGLVVVLTVGEAGMLVLLSEASQLVPSWCAAPDATGESKLKTLAQELSMLLLPDSLPAKDFLAGRARQLLGAMGRAGVADSAWRLGIPLSASDGRQGTAWVVWPVDHPAVAVGTGASRPKAAKAPVAKRPAARPSGPGAMTAPAPRRVVTSLRDLPDYSRSLLRIRVPVVVTLAGNRQPLGRIVELGPGSIIHFEKSCEEMLDLEVGGRRVAHGEAVKVGDKFGLRITSVVLPEERFKPVPPRRR